MANSVIKHIQVGPSGTTYDIVNQKVKVGTTTFDDNAVVSITGSNGVSVVGATGTNPTITVKGPSNYVIGGSQTTTSSADGGSNVFTFNKSDGTSATFTVKNGSKGSTGAVGPTGPTGPAPDLTKYPTLAGTNTFTGSNWFKGNSAIITTQNGIRIGFSNGVSPDADSSIYSIDKYGFYGQGKNQSLQTIKFPDLSTFSTATHTIPLSDTNNTFTGTNLFKGGTTQFLTSSAGLNDPKTDVGAYGILCQTGGNVGTYYKDGKITNGTNTLTLPLKTGTVALTSDIDVTAAGNNTFTGTNKFYGSVNIRESTASEGNFVEISGTGSIYAFNNEYNSVSGGTGKNLILQLPLTKEGSYTIATTDDIDVTLAGNNRFTGSNSFTSGISIIEDANNKTIYNSGHIANYTQSGSYTLYLPSKSGLVATTNDIPIKTATLSGTTLSITLS